MVEDTHPGFISVLGQIIGTEKNRAIEGDHEISKRYKEEEMRNSSYIYI